MIHGPELDSKCKLQQETWFCKQFVNTLLCKTMLHYSSLKWLWLKNNKPMTKWVVTPMETFLVSPGFSCKPVKSSFKIHFLSAEYLLHTTCNHLYPVPFHRKTVLRISYGSQGNFLKAQLLSPTNESKCT